MGGTLGIYFGSRVISIVETQGKKIVKNLTVLRPSAGMGGLEEKVPEDIKLSALVHEELRSNQVSAKEAVISLSGKDLIFRTFELPMLSQNELVSAVNFEAKKYIPFKVEDLVFDFQVQYDRISRKNLVLFFGIRKDALSKYLAIINESGIKTVYVDYSAFSVLRFMKLVGEGYKGISGVVSVDFDEDGEAHFSVLENGFPAFSRDITLASGPRDLSGPGKELESGMFMEKFKTEMRISLDYYHRKFPSKKIGNLYFLADDRYRGEIESFLGDIGVNARFVDVSKHLGGRAFSLSFIKGYGCALFSSLPTNFKVNLLSPKARSTKKVVVPRVSDQEIPEFRLNWGVIFFGLFVCGAAYGYGLYRSLPVRGELEEIVAKRIQIANVDSQASYETLKQLSDQYQVKIKELNAVVLRQLYLTNSMNAVPKCILDNLWLTGFTFQRTEQKVDLTLQGFASLGDSAKEMELVTNFAERLRANPEFGKDFKTITIISLEETQIEKFKATSFVISCKTQK